MSTSPLVPLNRSSRRHDPGPEAAHVRARRASSNVTAASALHGRGGLCSPGLPVCPSVPRHLVVDRPRANMRPRPRGKKVVNGALNLLLGDLQRHLSSASGASVVAIDNKIEQAMDLVKSHLMYAVREEVEVLKEQIKELIERNSQLEQENHLLKSLASPEQLQQMQTQLPAPAVAPGQPGQLSSTMGAANPTPNIAQPPLLLPPS